MNLDDIIKGFGFGGETSPIPRCSKSSSVATHQKEKTCNWIVTEPGRKSFEVHCSPLASMSEVLDERPDGTTATPCEQKPVKAISPPAINIEPWRDRLLAQLDENPVLNYVIEVALPDDGSPAIEICVVRRGVGTFTILVPREMMTPLEGQLKILELFREWTSAVALHKSKAEDTRAPKGEI